MEFLTSMVYCIFIGWMWDRIRRLEKAVARIDNNALKEVKSEEASRNYW